MTKEEWVEWKSMPVTEEFFARVQERIQDSLDILAETAGIDSVNDSFHRGFITALREVLNTTVED